MTSTEQRISKPWSRLGDVVIYALGQLRTVMKIYPGIMHLLIFWGVIFQVIGTAIKIMQMGLFVPFTWPLFSGPGYIIYELIMDLAGVAILLGVVMAMIRRFIIRPDYMENSWDDIYALILLACIPLVGFFTEGLRILAWNPLFAGWSPIGNWVALLLRKTALSPSAAALIHSYIFILHVILGLLLAASIPFTKLRHMIFTPIHIFMKSDRPSGELETIPDIMDVEVLGTST
ncbi:MAG: hypothetical protein DRI65_15725, partial [Chloroflexota bacterium]